MKATAATLSAATLVVLLVAGCARLTPGAGGSASPQPSDGGTGTGIVGDWILTRATHGGAPISVPDGWQVTLRFTDDGEVGGQACNHYGGTYDFDAGRITLSAMSMTEMACEDPMMDVEAAYHAALAEITGAERQGDRLTLRGDAVELVYELRPEVPDAALEGTSWMLESLIQGDAVASVQGEPALVLQADGTFTGSTGCRDISGDFTVDGAAVTLGSIVTTDQACEAALEAQDRFVLDVLEGGFTVAIDGNHLTLTASDGNGLDYLSAGEDGAR